MRTYRVFIKYWVFSQEFSIFCDLAFTSTRLLLYSKWPANKSDCTLRSQIRWVALLDAGVGLQWIRKKRNFNEHPVWSSKKYQSIRCNWNAYDIMHSFHCVTDEHMKSEWRKCVGRRDYQKPERENTIKYPLHSVHTKAKMLNLV